MILDIKNSNNSFQNAVEIRVITIKDPAHIAIYLNKWCFPCSWNWLITKSQAQRYTNVPPANDLIDNNRISETLYLRMMPSNIPNGLAEMNSKKNVLVNQEFNCWLFYWKVVPSVNATGILWMMTLMARTVISPILLKTPIAIPSIKLCMINTMPKVAIVTLSILYLSLGNFSTLDDFMIIYSSSHEADVIIL